SAEFRAAPEQVEAPAGRAHPLGLAEHSRLARLQLASAADHSGVGRALADLQRSREYRLAQATRREECRIDEIPRRARAVAPGGTRAALCSAARTDGTLRPRHAD